MLHSIIIPHRGRDAHLRACLARLAVAIAHCGEPDPEIVLCGEDQPAEATFNKCRALNEGVERSTGDVLTFIDCDAIVGLGWPAAFRRLLDDPGLTKLCYRVRYWPGKHNREHDLRYDPALMAAAFAEYETYPLAFEGRVWPHQSQRHGEPLFGNSQFSITRSALGDVRWDEGYEGAGWEDVSMNRAIWRRHGDGYRAAMPESPDESLFHLAHSRKQPLWRTPATLTRNHTRYWRTNGR